MPLFTTHNRKKCFDFPLSIAAQRGKAGMPRSVQGCFSALRLIATLYQKIIFLPRPQKKRDAFPRFFWG